jgi:hypothetical protein
LKPHLTCIGFNPGGREKTERTLRDFSSDFFAFLLNPYQTLPQKMTSKLQRGETIFLLWR